MTNIDPTHHNQPSYNKVRNAARASYDRDAAYDVLDKAIIGHLGFVIEGRPMVIPMAFARLDDTIYLHGASKTRAALLSDQPLCFTVTHLDGLVMARSGMHHSANYRSVVVHGQARLVNDIEEKTRALWQITDHLLPGRNDEIRPMNAQELKATGVVAMEIEALSLKQRSGPPKDDPEDEALGLWGGVLPVHLTFGNAVADPLTPNGVGEPQSVAASGRKFT